MTTYFLGCEGSSFTRAGANEPLMQTTISDGLLSPFYDNTRVRSALWCANTADPYNAYADLSSPLSEGWLHFEMNNYNTNSILFEQIVFHSAANANAKQIRFVTTNVANNTWLMQYSSNGGASWTNISATTYTFGSESLRRFDINFKFHATTGFLKIYVNETLVWSYTGALVTQDNVVDRIFFGSTNGVVGYSQVIVADDSTIGHRVHAIYPNGAGAVSEWTGSYTDVDDIIPNLTDMLATDTVNNRVLYAYSDINPTTFATWDVVAVASVLDGTVMIDATVNDIKNAFRHSDGTEYFTAGLGFAKDNTRQKKTTIWATNPVTGIAWLLADVNNGQFGARAA